MNISASRQPANTAFKQQKLPAWQPIISPRSVYPIFFVIGLLFLPLGVVLLLNSNSVVEFVHDYTDCLSLENSSETCGFVRSNQFRMEQTCTCQINFTLTSAITGDVYAYYGLSNFFQNHRRYVKSRDDIQLFGESIDTSQVNSDCQPYALRLVNSIFKVIAPCGAIANSLFNDTFDLSYMETSVPLLRTGIAWPSDKNFKFNNPTPTNDLESAFRTYAQPFFWQIPVQYLDNSSVFNNGYKNEAFIVWMRTAAFPHFRKTYGKVNRQISTFANGLDVGQYSLTLLYNYPVKSFSGKKRFILSNTTWSGGKNNFLGIAYIVFGSICMLTSVILFCVDRYAKKIHVMKDE